MTTSRSSLTFVLCVAAVGACRPAPAVPGRLQGATHQETFSSDPFEGVFPPVWKVVKDLISLAGVEISS